MNRKDLKDVASIIYWLSAVEQDCQALAGNVPGSSEPKVIAENALRCAKEAMQCAERVARGTNRTRPKPVGLLDRQLH